MSVKKLANGKWRAHFRYEDALGKTHQKKKETFRTKKEAQEWEREFIATHAGKAVPGMTYDDLFQRFIADSTPRWKPSTLQCVTSSYNSRIKPYLGDLQLDDITPATIHAVHMAWAQAGMAYRSQQTVNGWLSAAYNFGVLYCGLASNPVPLAPLQGTPSKPRFAIWTEQEFSAFISRVPNFFAGGWRMYPPPTFKLLFRILFWGGFRIGEAMGLTISDINYDRRTISITKQRTQRGIDTPKTPYSIRDVIMPRAIMRDIQEYVDTIYEPNQHSLLFPMALTSPGQYWRDWQDRYSDGLPYLRIHDLRHSHASLLIDLGFSAQAIADRLGHKNADQVIKTYGHLYASRRHEIADRLDDLLSV